MTKKRALVTAALLLCLAALFIQDRTGWPYNWPTYWQEQKDVHANFGNAHNKNHDALQKSAKVVVEKDGNVNPDATAASMNRQIDISVRLDDDQEALEARLEHRIPRNAVPIPAGQSAWMRIGYVDGPVWIRVAGKIGEGAEASGPEGIYPEGKPAHYINSKTVVEVAREERSSKDTTWVPLRAFLGRFCKQGVCGNEQPVPDKTLVCGPAGVMEGWFNERIVIAGQKTASVFYYNSFAGGSYFVWLDPDGAADACNKINATN